MKKYSDNQLGEEMLSILSETPSWVIRTGAGVMSGIVLLFFVGTWVIKYPEVLKGNAIVTTQVPPIRVVVPMGGRMVRLLAKDEMMVKKGDVLAETENTTRLENIPTMQQLISDAQAFLQNPQREIVFPSNNFVWGDLQEDFNALRQNYRDFKRIQSDTYQSAQGQTMQQQAEQLRALAAVNERQKMLNEEEFANEKEHFLSDEKLFNEGIYSKFEYIASKNKHLKKQREREEFLKNTLDNNLKINELEAELRVFDQTFLERKRLYLDNIERSVHNIENSLRNWQQNYLITAPADGKLVFLKNLTENQHLSVSDTLFAVMPTKIQFIATMDIPVHGMGKAEVGQKVIIKLDDYPYQEFGMLEGRVLSLAPSLNVRYYRVMVALPKGLKSTYNQTFVCKSEMAGTAEIVTADLRLIERAFYGFRKVLM
ncbi:HlyD family efflux transporter periplasmic adaptor subunit [Runella aurantiaca]|uniref:HlyD family efflux transporter periplasmic adaptor subunit n=1 Tax=Runella aurantiaca TaxID=2282308 RepID=A0A369IGW1_9BACT|nr:HlyD family efflux transporter periplasmic adaptor subunit [Runella aurantiaca]RDB07435.1 HlyD family efflux transporter periplasmic adaptor subunit [Runella aurantiaca]